MERISKFLKTLDFFGVIIYFQYDDIHQKYQSITGGLIFFILIIFLILYINLNINSFIHRKNLSLLVYDQHKIDTDIFNFDDYKLAFSSHVTCDYLDNNSISDIFEIEFNYVEYNYNKTLDKKIKNKTKLKTKLCNYSNFYNEFNYLFDLYNLSTAYCPSTKNYSIKGTFNDDVFTYIEILLKIKEDKNETNYYDNLEYILNNFECKLHFSELKTFIDVHNYKNPIQRTIIDRYNILEFTKYKKSNYFYKIQNFQTDENILIENYKIHKSIIFDEYEMNNLEKGYDRFREKPKEYNYFYKIILRTANKNFIIQRKYQKLPEFVADSTSMFSSLFALFYVVMTYINKYFCYCSLINKIFHFKNNALVNNKNKRKKNNNNNDNKRKIIRKNKTLNNFSSNYFTSNNINNNNYNNNYNIDLSFKKEESMIKFGSSSNFLDCLTKRNNFINNKSAIQKEQKNSKYNTVLIPNNQKLLHLQYNTKRHLEKNVNIKLNLFELLFVFFCSCIKTKKINSKQKILSKLLKIFVKHIQILNFIKKSQQIELLNFILLNDEENRTIEFLSKPAISFIKNDTKIQSSINITNIKTIEMNNEEIETFFNYYNKLKNKKNKTFSEKKIFELCDVQIKNLLNE
jgi:hypothetical protein